MPIPPPRAVPASLFPSLYPSDIDATRTSAWYPIFRHIAHKTTIIDLDVVGEKTEFLAWLEADSIFIPEDSRTLAQEAGPSRAPSSLSSGSSSSSHSSNGDCGVDRPNAEISNDDDGGSEDNDGKGDQNEQEDEDSDEEEEERPVYRLPKLNVAIREAIKQRGGAVFPKLNWSSPKDAAFILPQTSHGPLHCASPADVYLLLKSSDFISHGLDPSTAYAMGENHTAPGNIVPEEEEDFYDPDADEDDEEEKKGNAASEMKIELVLKEFIEVNPSREFRCFVRNNILIGISQRDSNYYEHLQKPDAQARICHDIRAFWEDEIRGRHPRMGDDYTFDVHLTANPNDTQLIDFNPYRISTDPLQFSYHELLDILRMAQLPITAADVDPRPRLPILKVIDSPSHPSAGSTAPAFSGNMMPVEMLELSQGRSLQDFQAAWADAIARGMTE